MMKGLKIGHVNIRSMFLKMTGLSDLVALFDIMCVSESWLTKDMPDNKVYIQDYQLFRLDRVVEKVGGGLVIYIRDPLFEFCSIEPTLSTSDSNIEVFVLNITQPKHRLLSIIHVYRPPNGCCTTCITKLVDICKSPLLEGRELWLIGDVNIDLLTPDDWKTKLYHKSITDLNIDNLITEITRPNPNPSIKTGTCIDFMATTCEIVSNSGVLPVYLSDHLPTFATRKKYNVKPIIRSVEGRSYRLYDVEDFGDYILNIDWQDFNRSVNVDEKWSLMLDQITSYLDEHCPIKSLVFKDYNKPWMNKDILELIYERNQCMYIYCMDKVKNLPLLKRAQKLRDDINIQSENSKNSYFEEKLETLSVNPTKFWREINTLLGNISKNSPSISFDHHEDGHTVSGDDVPEYINTFFTNIGGKLFNDLGTKPNVSPMPQCRVSCEAPVSNHTVSYSEVLAVIKKIVIHKSSGITHISTKVLKDALLLMAPQLTSLINTCLCKMSFPVEWAKAKVVPLPKKGNLRQIGNWRPISLLPVPSKVMERVMYTRIYHWLESNDKINKFQYGFRASRGTGDAVFSLVNDLYGARDHGEAVASCFLDVRKAFDSVHHGELITRLVRMGMPDLYTNWLIAYLKDRSQSVLCNNKLSVNRPVPFGVPQGSILGPLLFICYINDLPSVLHNCTVSMYADDVVFYCKHTDHKRAIELLQVNATRAYDWFSGSGLCINTDKTEVVVFNWNKNRCVADIRMGGHVLNQRDEYEYLGVTIDKNLNFNRCLTKTISTVYLRLYLLSKIRKMMPKNTACLIYKQTILPVIEYCGFIYNGLTDTIRKRLQRIQNRCLRVCLRTQRMHPVAELHTGSGADYIDVRFDLQLLLLVHKYMYSGKEFEAGVGITFKRTNPAARQTRSVGTAELNVPRDIKRSYRKSPIYRGICLWNSLPPSCRLNTCKVGFRAEAKLYIAKLSEKRRLGNIR